MRTKTDGNLNAIEDFSKVIEFDPEVNSVFTSEVFPESKQKTVKMPSRIFQGL